MDVLAIMRSKRESVIFLLVTCSPFVLVEKKRCLEVVYRVNIVPLAYFLQLPIYLRKCL